MAKKPDGHAGSGIDQPDPKTLLEKVGDGLKSVLPKKPKAAPSPPLSDGTLRRAPQ